MQFMFLALAQNEAPTSGVADVAKDLLKEASHNGPVVFIAVAFLLIFSAMFAVYFWYVLRPDRDSRRELERSNGAAMTALAQQTIALGNLVVENRQVSGEGRDASVHGVMLVQQLIRIQAKSLSIFKKIAGAQNLDIGADLAEMLGAIETLQHVKPATGDDIDAVAVPLKAVTT